MNRNYLIGFAAAAAVLGLLAFAAWSFLEVVPITKNLPPSREARINGYLALDRWLEGMGIPVRTESSGNLSTISRAEEKRIFIQSSLFHWNDEAEEYLIRWIEEGGQLFLALDIDPIVDWYDDVPELLLEEFGIELETGKTVLDYHYDSSESPDYDRRVSFELSGAEDALALKDWNGLTKLVQVKRGRGKLTVTGRPRFLLSAYLDEAPNARLAWALFAEHHAVNQDMSFTANIAAPGGGWLFIRGTTRQRGLVGNLFRQGNLPALLVSVLVLLVICFWTVIPIFGLVRRDDEKPGRPLRERFLAEGRFLKRYGALEFYRDTFVKEIRRRLARREGLFTDSEIENRVLDIRGKPARERDRRNLVRVLRGEPIKYREFPGMIAELITILERI